MQKIIEVLEESKSTYVVDLSLRRIYMPAIDRSLCDCRYVPSFLRLCEDVSVAMTEANDNVKFLCGFSYPKSRIFRFKTTILC